jgi:hypothetical protein
MRSISVSFLKVVLVALLIASACTANTIPAGSKVLPPAAVAVVGNPLPPAAVAVVGNPFPPADVAVVGNPFPPAA